MSFTYPGVYLNETVDVPHVVNPATTSLTAFIGDYGRGPAGQAVLVQSWDEFSRMFGGLLNTSLASYAVQQFFVNGGGGAWIVRITAPGSAEASATVTDLPVPGGLTFTARSPGEWGNALAVSVAVSSSLAAALQKCVDVNVVQTSPTGPTTVESLTNLATSDLGELAKLISERSSYVSAAVAPSSAGPPRPAPAPAPAPAAPSPSAADPPAASPAAGTTPAPSPAGAGSSAPQPVPLANGSLGSWTADTYVSAVLSQLGAAPTSAPAGTNSPAQLGSSLDRIAPQVFNILCLPDMAWLPAATQIELFSHAHDFCRRRQAFFLVDPPPPALATGTAPPWVGTVDLTVDNAGSDPDQLQHLIHDWAASLLAQSNFCAAAYYPWVQIPDPLNGNRPRLVPPSGTIAGIYAFTDAARGVWKAPAGVGAALTNVIQLADSTINDDLNGQLNVAGINCLRTFAGYGNVVWGSRTLAGGDVVGSAWKYVPVRRLTDFLEQSLIQSLKWAVFEPNSEPLWSSIRLEVNDFMLSLFAEGAFGGATAAAAFQVGCDATTTTTDDILRGIVNLRVGFQPAEPAEFVVLNLQLNAGAPAAG